MEMMKGVSEELIKEALREGGWILNEYDFTNIIEASHIKWNALIRVLSPGGWCGGFHGKIVVANREEFCKWGNSADYICHRFPRNERQLRNLLDAIPHLMESDRKNPSRGGEIDITRVLTKKKKKKKKKGNEKREHRRGQTQRECRHIPQYRPH